jgi:WD40 repeat protein
MENLFNPFPGLRPFEAHENHLFFGRDGQSDELLTRLRRNRFLAVVGTSGSGKSSLVRAGMLPALYGGLMSKAGSRWRIAVFRPGNAPIRNLAEALNAVFDRGGEPTKVYLSLTETALRRGAVGLIEAVQEMRMPARDNLLLVVDQFEELFRFKQAAQTIDSVDEAAAFVKLLLEAGKQYAIAIYVVLTMRSDYLGDCAQFRDLPEAINDGQYLIPRMTRDQRRQAIAGPVAVGGAKMTPRLVNRLLNDVGDNPDQLPILQHALMRTWDYWALHHKNHEPIDLPHYEAIGGMEKALSLHADEAYDELVTSRSKMIAEKLFKALTEKGADNREIRRPTFVRDACALAEAQEQEVVAVVDTFRRSGRTFLMPPAEVKLRAETLIDISHESLIRNWERLKKWVEEEAQSAQIYRRLAETAVLYQEGRAGLWRDPDLHIALDWQKQNRPNEIWAKRYAPQFADAIKFLEKSQTARDAEIAEKEAARQRELQQALALAEAQQKRAEAERERAEEQARAASKLRRRAVALALIGLLALIAAILAGVSSVKLKMKNDEITQLYGTVEDLQGKAKAEQAKADSAKAAAAIATALAREKVEEAAREARKAERLQQMAVGLRREANRLAHRADSLKNVAAIAAANERHAEARADSLRRAADKDRAEAERLRRVSASLFLAAQAPFQENDTLAVVLAHQAYLFNKEADGNVNAEVYDALRGSLNRPRFKLKDGKYAGGPDTLRGHKDWGRAVAFRPTGVMMASGSADSTIRLWRLEGNKLRIDSLRGHNASVRSLVFSPDGRKLASGSDDHTVRLWDLENLRVEKIFTGHHNWVWTVAFSPDGRKLASGSLDSTVMIWPLTANDPPQILRGHRGSVRSIAFNFEKNGSRWLASASVDSTVRLWDLQNLKSEPKIFRQNARVRAVVFSPNNQWLAVGDDDAKVRVWSLGNLNQPPRDFQGHTGAINAVAFSPDSQVLASASADGTAKLWDVDRPQIGPLASLPHGDYWVWSLAFNQDGTQLATASSDNGIRLWVARLNILAERARRIAERRKMTDAEWEKFVGKEVPRVEATGKN